MESRVPSSDSPELSVVVLFTHDPVLARRCVDSIAALGSEIPQAETIFLLGGSSPEVRKVIAGTVGARVIDSPVNLGTSVAWQLGFNAAKGRHVLLMHEDAVATPGMAKSLIDALDSDPAAAVVAPWLAERDDDAPSNCGWAWFRGLTQTRLLPEHVPPELRGAPYAVDGVSSAITLWDRSAWLEGGGFDERNFPALGVDADACTSAWARGRSVLVDPRTLAVHRTGAMDDAPGRLSGKFVRYFMLERFERLWQQKWGEMSDWYTELAAETGVVNPEEGAVRAAHLRRAERPQLAGPVPLAQHPFTDPEGTGAQPTEVDAQLAERLRIAVDAATDEYHLWLIEHSERQHAEIEHLNEAVRSMSAREAATIKESDRLVAELAAIKTGRVWRMRTRARRLLGMRE